MRGRLESSSYARQRAGAGRIAQGRREYAPVGSGEIVHDFYSPELPHLGLIDEESWSDREQHLMLRRSTGRGGLYPATAPMAEEIASAGSGMVFQGCKKQDVFSRAYRDVFTAALKDHPGTCTVVRNAPRFPEAIRRTLNTRKVFDIAAGSLRAGTAAIQELRIGAAP